MQWHRVLSLKLSLSCLFSSWLLFRKDMYLEAGLPYLWKQLKKTFISGKWFQWTGVVVDCELGGGGAYSYKKVRPLVASFNAEKHSTAFRCFCFSSFWATVCRKSHCTALLFTFVWRVYLTGGLLNWLSLESVANKTMKRRNSPSFFFPWGNPGRRTLEPWQGIHVITRHECRFLFCIYTKAKIIPLLH